MSEARNADLYEYLMDNHSEDFVRQGNSIRMLDDDGKPTSLCIGKGFNGYHRFSNDEAGNPVDFLTRYYDYTLPEAVLALCDLATVEKERQYVQTQNRNEDVPKPREISFPKPAENNRRVYAYLTRQRGIPGNTVNMLIKKGLLYQDEKSNCIFANRERDCYEWRSTYTIGIPRYPHGCRKTLPNRFWWFGNSDAKKVYVCEGAIDAISLYELLNYEKAIYVSMIGVANQSVIDRIAGYGKFDIVLALDNDSAGAGRQMLNWQMQAITPKNKDWNDDLQEQERQKAS